MGNKRKINLAAAVFLALICIVISVPLASVFVHSLEKHPAGMAENLYQIFYLPFPVSLGQYYRALIQERETLYYFWNSVKIAFPILLFNMMTALPGGYALAKFKFPCKRIIFFCYVLVMLLPVQVGIVGTYIFFDKIHLLDKQAGVVLANMFSPLGTFLIYQFLKVIPDNTLESARIEGAGELTIFWRIVLPQAKAGIASMAILVLIDAWNVVEAPMLLLRRQVLQPMSVMLRYVSIGESDTVFADIMLFAIPMLLVFALFQDSLSEGIAHSVPIKK